MHNWVLGSGICLSMFGLLAGCTRSGSGIDAKALQVQLTSDPVTLDPALAEDGISLRVLSNVMEGLVSYDGAGNLRMALADSLEVSIDKKTYRYHIRDRASWSDGLPVTASQFVAGLRRSLAPGSAAKLADLYSVIKGAPEYRVGKASANLLGVRVEGDRVVVIELSTPISYLGGILALTPATPFREDLLKEGRWNELGPSTGPYKIGHRRLDELIVLEPNAYWWGLIGKTVLTYPPVVFRVVHDESTGVSLFETGKLDILSRVPVLDLPRLKKQGSVQIDPFLATFYLAFNTHKPPFDQALWRRAVSGVIDRVHIASLLGSGELPARTWIPKGLEGFREFSDPTAIFADSVRQVKQIITREKGPLEISATFDSGSRNSTILERIQQDLKINLGLKVTLTHQDWKSYIKGIQSDASPIFRFGWLAPFKDPISHLMVFTSKSPNNYTGWSNPEYDSLVNEISVLEPGPLRVQKIARAQAILVDQQAVVVPIYHYVQTSVVSSRVKDFKVNPFGVTRFDELSLSRGR